MNINEKKLQNEKIVELKIDEHLDTAFPDGIPSNAILSKGRCGIGGTTLELNSKRHSFIIVPNIPTIESKLQNFRGLIGVYGGISKIELKRRIQQVLEDGEYLKIMSTPDSFSKLVDACQEIGFDLYKECFVLWDEYHTMITELSYRKNMVKPLEHFFLFDNKSFISATPYKTSDPRFDEFERIRIVTKHLNDEVEVVFTEDVYATLKSLVEQVRERGNNNAHIFYNSVKSIADFLPLVGNTDDISVFCADKKENRGNLGEFSGLLSTFEEQERESPFRRLNFYTTKYYEGWDLHDENAVKIMLKNMLISASPIQPHLLISTK